MYLKDKLPDITSSTLIHNALALQWVGMEEISVPLMLSLGDERVQTLVAKADIYVSLDKPTVKGIHMSRLHAILNQLGEEDCTKAMLDRLMDKAVASQAGISSNAKINLAFDVLLKKPALLSDESGYQSYKMAIKGEVIEGTRSYEIEVTIPYSSTCPCSASLSAIVCQCH